MLSAGKEPFETHRRHRPNQLPVLPTRKSDGKMGFNGRKAILMAAMTNAGVSSCPYLKWIQRTFDTTSQCHLILLDIELLKSFVGVWHTQSIIHCGVTYSDNVLVAAVLQSCFGAYSTGDFPNLIDKIRSINRECTDVVNPPKRWSKGASEHLTFTKMSLFHFI